MSNNVPNSHYDAQFLFDEPAKVSPVPAAPSAGKVLRKINSRLSKSSAITGIVIGAAMGGLVGAGAGIATQGFLAANGTIIVNNSDHVNWVTAVAKAASPSVVTISVSGSNGSGSGSGVVLTKSGYILTNTHVVTLEGSTATPVIEVRTVDGKVYSATVVGTDPTNDLAVVKVTAITSLTPAVFADSSKINVGDNVVAIGSPLGLDTTVTAGIVSALNRTIQVANSAAPENGSGTGGGLQFFNGNSSTTAVPINISVIQTDAAINPGNSGGALLNDQGQVLGINVAIASAGNTSGNGQTGSIGVGFAIPANNAQRIAAELIKSGKASHAMLGAFISDAMSSNSNSSFSVGAKIAKLMPNSPAGKAGIQVGDVVVKINDEVITSASDLTALVRQLPAGAKAIFEVQRAGKVLTISVTLGDAVNLGK